MNNSLYLRRKNKVLVEKGSHILPENYVAAILKNIESLGYTFSPDLIARLNTNTLEYLTDFYQQLVQDLRTMVGAHRQFKPMYPNFPQQVIEMSEGRLYLNAIIHYWTNRLPEYVKRERLPLPDKTELRIIDSGTAEDFEGIFTRLAASNTSLSVQDKEDVQWFVENYRDDVYRLLPDEIKSKETIAFVGGLLIANTDEAESFLARYVKTATDVLRLATAMSGGDISLAENTKFRTFKRRERRTLLSLLEKTGHPTEDMLRWKKRWIRLGEKLHVGDYAERFPQTFAAFDVLRNDKPFETFNSKIEKTLLEKDVPTAIESLSKRAGDFARRLDHLLRVDENGQGATLTAFATVAEQVSTPVLLQVLTHFRHRNAPSDLRVFFPKGSVAKVQAIINELPILSEKVCAAAVNICENVLISRFKNLSPLGKCYLDENLKNFLVPFSQRSASKALRTIVRGSRNALPEGKVLRFFLWWKNGIDRTDIDLSAALYDAEFNYRDIVSYYNLKNYGGHHSGDIVDAPEGAAEFIDIDIAKTLEMNIRYVVTSLNSFTHQPYRDLPECFAGWMMRTHADSGEIFEPKTVKDKIDLTSDTRICLPAIIDLVKGEVIWTDIALKKTNLYELFELHIKARGEVVNSKEEAETIFSVEQGVTPFDIEVIAAEFM
jgi:hypothetical protein